MVLTETQIKQAKPGTKPYKLTDGQGLSVEVRPTGAKVFIKGYRYAGQRRSESLGAYPQVKLAGARLAAADINEKIKKGEDPRAGLPRRAKAPVPVEVPEERRWDNLCDKFIAKRVAEGIAEATEKKLRWNLGATCQEFAQRDVATIKGPEVLALIERVQEIGKFDKAKDMHRKITQVMDYAVARGLMEHNPAYSVRRAIVNRKGGKHPGLVAPLDVGALMRAIKGFHGEATTRAGLLLSAYTFLRSSEIRPARWGEIDRDEKLWTVPPERMKGHYGEHLVPLSDQAMAVLEWLHPWTGGKAEDYIFPCSFDRSRYMSNATMNAALRRLGYNTRTEHCQHGFRTTFSTNMNEMGWNRDWIERQLCHVDRDEVRSVYNKALYLEDRKVMMQAYSDWLEAAAHKKKE